MYLRTAAMLAALAGASACTYVPEPEIISGTAEEVAVKAGSSANPGPLAIRHCASYGKNARLRDSVEVSRGEVVAYFSMRTATRVFYFDCVQ